MLWDVPIVRALSNTFLVGIGAAVLSTFVATCLAVSTRLIPFPGSRLLSALVGSMILIPLYVQAAAWSAGFGQQGWFRWNQVVAASNPWYAILACIWIHSSWLIPINFLIVRLGLEQANDDSVKTQWLDGGFGQILAYLLFRRSLPWILACFVIGFVLTSSDMIVTNLFQVPTLTESLYQQVQFQRINSHAFAVAMIYSVFVGLVSACSARPLEQLTSGARNRKEDSPSGGLPTWLSIFSSLVAVSAFVVFIGLPLASLLVKTGWKVGIGENGITRTWSLTESANAMMTLRSFSNEFYWSCVISATATATSLILGWLCVPFCQSRWSSAIGLGVVGLTMSLPGPIINALLQWLFVDCESAWIATLRDRTVMMPVLGLQFRSLPIVFGVLWISQKRFYAQYDQMMELDGSSWFQHRMALVRPMIVASMIAFVLCFANLESYLLVLPPAVTTIAMRMFELLHYGVQNQESVLALFLALASSLIGFLLTSHFKR